MELHPDHRIAGVLAPLFALRGRDDQGIGDLAALREFIDWAAQTGFRLVQLLPINETGADNSPYMAISSAAIEPSTLEVTPRAIPDLSEAQFKTITAGTDFTALRKGPVNYRVVKPLKMKLLAAAFDHFSQADWRRNSRRAREFRAFVAEQASWLGGYALFRVLMEEHAGSECWDTWPPEHATAERARLWLAQQPVKTRRSFEQRMRFYEYVQWLAFTQWRAIKKYAESRRVALMGDIPFGISYYSADVFAAPELFRLDWSGGAPPEPYFKDDPFVVKWGQNWGVPLYDWDRMRGDGFAWWRERVHLVRGMFHLFRIDHILGFYRIYGFPWRPQRNAEFLPLDHDQARARTGGALPHFIEENDDSMESRMRNQRRGEEYLRVLCEVVGEFRLIGEDLGTVPPYVRPSLTSMGIAGFKIPIWERKPDGWLIDGHAYQRLSVVTLATHDHEPMRALWERLLRECHDPAFNHHDALMELRKIAGFAGIDLRSPQPWNAELHRGLLRSLFASNSWLAIVMVTDLFATEQRFNVPGAIAESNWSERLPLPIAQWKTDPQLKVALANTRDLLASTRP